MTICEWEKQQEREQDPNLWCTAAVKPSALPTANHVCVLLVADWSASQLEHLHMMISQLFLNFCSNLFFSQYSLSYFWSSFLLNQSVASCCFGPESSWVSQSCSILYSQNRNSSKFFSFDSSVANKTEFCSSDVFRESCSSTDLSWIFTNQKGNHWANG